MIKIDLLKMFGPQSFTAGISYDPQVCYPPLSVSKNVRLERNGV